MDPHEHVGRRLAETEVQSELSHPVTGRRKRGRVLVRSPRQEVRPVASRAVAEWAMSSNAYRTARNIGPKFR